MTGGGTYALLLRLDERRTVRVGALGLFTLPPGWYLYLGSAHGPGGLQARIARHRRTEDKRLHWHIDYLRAEATLVQVWTYTGPERLECAWAAAAAALPGAALVVPRFGASDCRCPSHLFHYPRPPDLSAFEALVGRQVQKQVISAADPDELLARLFDPRVADEQREGAAQAIAALGEAALPPLHDALQSDDAERRWWAARALAAIGGEQAITWLIEALADPDPDVRACAAMGLGALGAPQAIRPLTRLLADESAYVGRIAGNALIHIGPPAVPALIQALHSPSAAARAGAARALIPLADHAHDAIPALFAALDDESALVSYYAEEALERMGVGMVLLKP